MFIARFMKSFTNMAKPYSLVLFFLYCSCAVTHKQAVSYNASYIVIDSSIAKEEKMNAFLDPYRRAVDSAMNIIIGYSDMPLSKAQPECTLGDFMADAQLQYAQRKHPDVKISVINYGSIRLPYLPTGAISKEQVFEIM